MREIASAPKKTVKNILKSLLPQRLIAVTLERARIDDKQSVSHLTAVQRQALVALLKGFPLNIRAARPIEEAMVTRGGVSVKDINPRTMESRLIKGLYFAGEMIDVDGDTGGFNLQIAFSTGFLAGETAGVV
jgi:predicted Rossmann fold flavoprotein